MSNYKHYLLKSCVVGLMLTASINTYSQITLNVHSTSVKSVINKIEKQTDYRFFFEDNLSGLTKKVNINVKDKPINYVLDEVLSQTGICYTIKGNNQVVIHEAKQKNSQQTENKVIKGLVVDNLGEPIIGANIMVKGTANGTISDMDGNFTLNVPNNAVLTISYIGYSNQEVKVGDETNFTITLKEDKELLDEVVVVGYGVTKKVDLTGAVDVIKSEEITKQPAMQVSQALEGLSPGLRATQSSGQPGADGARFRVRGVGSINASSDPLILIDGVAGDINTLDPNDIDNISVLKDAGAAAIYGSRASNGVILVTTKRGKSGKISIDLNAYVGFQNPTNITDFLNATDYLRAIGDNATLEQYLKNPTDKDHYPDTKWTDLCFTESGFVNYENLSISGGNEKAQSRVSLSHQKQNGNIKNFSHERIQIRTNNDFKFNDKLSVNVDLNFVNTINDSPNSSANFILSEAYRNPAIYGAYYSDGRYVSTPTGSNVAAIINESGYSKSKSNLFKGAAKVIYKPIKEIILQASYGINYSQGYGKSWKTPYELYRNFEDATPQIKGGGPNNEAQLNRSNSQQWSQNILATAQFVKEFNKHSIDALFGYEIYMNKYEDFGASRYGYPIYLEILNAGNAENDSNYGSENHSALLSHFGKLSYNFDNRYLLSASLRHDGSSKFAPENRWGWFPSFSFGWNLHNESFFPKDIFLNRLKFRTSWGTLGNQSINSNFPYASLISIGASYYANGQIQQGASQNTMSNRKITWEKGQTLNIGLDFGMFNERLVGTLEYYVRKSSDLLGTLQIPYTIGLNQPTANVFSMQNSGLDVSLEWRHNINDFSYKISGNMGFLKNKVTDLNDLNFIKQGGTILQVGETINSIYGYESIGLFKDQDEINNSPKQFGKLTPGDIHYKDQLTIDTDGDGKPDKADGVINEDDRVIIGKPLPTVTFGGVLSLGYKNFDLSVNIQGECGKDIFLNSYLTQPLYNGGNISKWQMEESWRPDNLGAKFPVIKQYASGSNNSKVNSTYVFSADYLRLRNITLGYTFPKSLLAKTPFNRIRLYASCQNLFTIDKLPQGIDPLTPSSNGSVFNVPYPIAQSYTFGINVSF